MSESFDMVCIERDELRAQRDELLSALRSLYGWTKAEVEYFGANSPDDFIIEMVEKALAGDGYGGCQIAALTAQRDELLAALTHAATDYIDQNGSVPSWWTDKIRQMVKDMPHA